MQKWLCLPGKIVDSALAISLSTTSCAHVACIQQLPLPPAPCWCEGRMWSWRCSSTGEHTLPNTEPGLWLSLLYAAGCLLQGLDASDKPLPISSESDGTVPAVLVAARVVLFTHTSLCMHASAHIQIFYLCTPASACAEGYSPASLSSPLLRERLKGPLGPSQLWGPHRRGVLQWVKPARSWLFACSWRGASLSGGHLYGFAQHFQLPAASKEEWFRAQKVVTNICFLIKSWMQSDGNC